jgi:uncharacterized membrane protein
MQCPSCHNEAPPQTTFCSFCGAQLNTPPEATPDQPARSYGYAEPFPPGGLPPNTAAAISYLTIIPAIVFLIITPYNRMPLVRFHSIQCIALAVVSFVLQVCLTILQIIFHFMGLWTIFSLLHLVVWLGIFACWLVALLKASRGEYYKLPVIGDIAAKQANI